MIYVLQVFSDQVAAPTPVHDQVLLKWNNTILTEYSQGREEWNVSIGRIFDEQVER